MIGALLYMICIFFLHFFAKSLSMLLAAQILAGVAFGSKSDCCPNYTLIVEADLVSLPNVDDELCRRCRTSRSSNVFDDLGKRLLGDWTAPRSIGPAWLVASYRSVGMENPVCSSGKLGCFDWLFYGVNWVKADIGHSGCGLFL